MALIEKNDIYTVGYDPIDSGLYEFIDLLNKLDADDNTGFPPLFRQLYEQTEQHFERENQLMKQSSYPGGSEHQRVLAEFKQFKTRVDKGLIDSAVRLSKIAFRNGSDCM